MVGYLHHAYAASLAEFGNPRYLDNSGGWILERSVPSCGHLDAMNCYPFFVCQDWSRLHLDLPDLKENLVSLSLVTDPLGVYQSSWLQRCFADVMIPFKTHFIVNLERPAESFVSRHHQVNARTALRRVAVERCANPSALTDEWVSLYTGLIRRHGIVGISAFSRSSLVKQLLVPGLVVFRASYEEATVGMILWYVQEDGAYYHLGAYSDRGYELKASFALFWHALEHFTSAGLKWLALGSGHGVIADATDGLTRFKRGWANETRTVYFCGQIFDHALYAELASAKGVTATNYFPAYRLGEFR